MKVPNIRPKEERDTKKSIQESMKTISPDSRKYAGLEVEVYVTHVSVEEAILHSVQEVGTASSGIVWRSLVASLTRTTRTPTQTANSPLNASEIHTVIGIHVHKIRIYLYEKEVRKSGDNLWITYLTR